MRSNKTQTFYTIFSIILSGLLGLLLKFYKGPGHEWLNDGGATLFYEILWCVCAFLFFRSRKAVMLIPIWVFIITCILEVLQLWHPPFLEAMRANLIGRLILGTSFVWSDFPHYALGSFLGWLWLRQLRRIGYAKKSQS